MQNLQLLHSGVYLSVAERATPMSQGSIPFGLGVGHQEEVTVQAPRVQRRWTEPFQLSQFIADPGPTKSEAS